MTAKRGLYKRGDVIWQNYLSPSGFRSEVIRINEVDTQNDVYWASIVQSNVMDSYRMDFHMETDSFDIDHTDERYEPVPEEILKLVLLLYS